MRIYLVGGAVRDYLLGREPADRDYLVVGATEGEFLTSFPEAIRVGKSFPVFLYEGNEYAFARKLTPNNGAGERMTYGPQVTLEDELSCRDLTINAMCIHEGEIIDPFGGKEDLKNKVLRHVSSIFSYDPQRVFRVARLASTIGFSVAQETLELMTSIKDSLETLPSERVFAELRKALEGPAPRVFFDVLRKADVLSYWFKPLEELIGVEQPPEWHPEGDAYEHTMLVIEGVSGAKARFAALCHDFGKALTPADQWPKHYGHDKQGISVVKDWCRLIKAPGSWEKTALVAAKLHMRAKTTENPGKLVRIALESMSSWPEFKQLLLADSMTKEGKQASASAVKRIEAALEVVDTITGKDVLERWPNATGSRFGELLFQLRARELESREKGL